MRRVNEVNPARLDESCVEQVEPPIIQDRFRVSYITNFALDKYVKIEMLKQVQHDNIHSSRDTSRTNEQCELSETACRMAEGRVRVCHFF